MISAVWRSRRREKTISRLTVIIGDVDTYAPGVLTRGIGAITGRKKLGFLGNISLSCVAAGALLSLKAGKHLAVRAPIW